MKSRSRDGLAAKGLLLLVSYVTYFYENNYVNVDAAVDVLS